MKHIKLSKGELNGQLLQFGRGNAKLGKEIATFSLPSGWTCPGAKECMSKADRQTGKITDGPLSQFRCFSATTESAFPSVRQSRWHNFDLVKGKTRDEIYDLILASLPSDATIVRIHVGGDFFNEAYFRAWIGVARNRKATTFYAYTKSIHIWKKCTALIPDNFILTASEGGRFDDQINGFKRAKVVFSEDQAVALGLQIDHDDSHAYSGQESFALLLHGQQPKGSVAAKSISAMKAQGVKYSYSAKHSKPQTHNN